MYLIRRSVFRSITSSSTSFLSKSRPTTNFSPFINHTEPQVKFSSISRRFASNDGETEAHQPEAESTPSSSLESSDRSGNVSASSSFAESASDYASDAVENLPANASAEKGTAAYTDKGVAAAGFAYAPREDAREYHSRNYYRDDRRPAPASGFNVNRRVDYTRSTSAMQPSNSIYVGNLFFEVTEEDLERQFAEFGKILEVRISRDARNLSKGFGYVKYDSIEAATMAIQNRNNTIMDGRRLIVNYQLKTSRSDIANPPGKTIFIGNLAFEMSDADLNKLFQDIKNVMDVRVAIDRRTGQPRGFAHADFVDVESATKGMEYLQGKEFYGRTLRVDYAGTSRRSDGFGYQGPREGY